MSHRRSNEELLGVGGLLPACDCDSCVALRELERRLEAAEAETHDRILDRLLEAEKIDAEHGFTLPGDSALYITLAGMEETRGDRLRAAEGDGE